MVPYRGSFRSYLRREALCTLHFRIFYSLQEFIGKSGIRYNIGPCYTTPGYLLKQEATASLESRPSNNVMAFP
jgi:hypothetical protein